MALLTALIAAYEAIAMRPALAVNTLEVLAARQATADDPANDANPGKMLHELRTGEMARTGELPFGRPTPDGYPLTELAWASSGQMSRRFEIACWCAIR